MDPLPSKRLRFQGPEVPITRSGELTQAQQNLVRKRRVSGYSSRIQKRLESESWARALKDEFEQAHWEKLMTKLVTEKETQQVVLPPEDLMFHCFNLCRLEDVKVVLLGSEPHCEPGTADGLSFSVPLGLPMPRPLQTLFRELKEEMPEFNPSHGNLEKWAKQGVLLLNSTLTVRMNAPESHLSYGWSHFVAKVISVINQSSSGVVFILWGPDVHSYRSLINDSFHHVLLWPTPRKDKIFTRCNELLMQQGQTPVDWNLDDLNWLHFPPRGFNSKRLRDWDQEPSFS